MKNLFRAAAFAFAGLLPEAPSFAQKKTEIAYITGIERWGDYDVVNADFIQMLNGKAAVAAARKAGEAQYDLGKGGDTTWYVDNDYYIVNASKKIRRCPLMPDAAISLLKGGSPDKVKGTLAGLKAAYKDRIFRLTFESNRIVRIDPIFTP